MMRRLVTLALAGALGCANSGRTIKIPESAMAKPTKLPKKAAAGSNAYVIKMSDGERIWQVEIPNTSASFEAMVPLDLSHAKLVEGPPLETEADREVKAGAPAAAADGPTPSYLKSLALVNALFRKRQYELALIELTKLEQSYPEDERLLEMKGTLYWRLRKPKLAREAWERVLAINPDNAAVAQALENLLAE